MFIKNNSQINIFNMSFNYNHARMAFSTFNSPSSFKTSEKFDYDWVQWLIGFLDAEGNFQTFPKKRVRKDGSVHDHKIVSATVFI